MTSAVEIYNLALSNVRGGSINAFTDSSLQAQVGKLKYAFLRDRLLAEASWGFNHNVDVLSVLSTDIFNWAYAYAYPSDCLKINRLVNSYEELANVDADVVSRLIDSQLLPIRDSRIQVPYEIFNFSNVRTIGANETELRIDYLAKIEEPNLYSTDFILALSHLIASEIAIPIVGAELGRQLRSDELQIYNEYLNSAIANDANEQYAAPALSEYETIRR